MNKKFLVGLIIAMLGTLGIGLLCRQLIHHSSQEIVYSATTAKVSVPAPVKQLIVRAGDYQSYVPMSQRRMPNLPDEQTIHMLGVMGVLAAAFGFSSFYTRPTVR